MRYSLSSFEEQWVIVCYKFFEKYGFHEWAEIDRETAFKFMITESKGHIDPVTLKEKINELYKSTGC
jgi:hypothetical protein